MDSRLRGNDIEMEKAFIPFVFFVIIFFSNAKSRKALGKFFPRIDPGLAPGFRLKESRA
jgi:hypothetical protein